MAIDTREKRQRALNAVLHPVHAPLFPHQYNGKRIVDRTHVAGFYYPEVDPPHEYAIYYAIEVAPVQYVGEELPPTIEDVGLKNGVFRWITGAPGFYGSEIRLVDGDDEENKEICNYWYEGILIKNGLSNPSRKINIVDGGDYATLSGFSFSIRNDRAFWSILEENKIYITNSSVKVFAVLDKRFYSLWQGVVKSTSYTETDFEFNCESNFKAIHRQFPPMLTPRMVSGNVNEDQIIPVCFGNVPYAKGLKINNYTKEEVLVKRSEKDKYTFCAAKTYDKNSKKLSLMTNGVTFHTDGEHNLKNKYLCVVKGGGDEYYRIISNGSQTDGITEIELDQPLQGWDEDGKNAYSTDGNKLENDVWFFKIVDAYVCYRVSQRSINGFNKRNVSGNFKDNGGIIYNYEDGYRLVNFALLEDKDGNSNAEFFTMPENVASTKIDNTERVYSYMNVPTPTIGYHEYIYIFHYKLSFTYGFRSVVTFELKLEEDVDMSSFDQHHLCFEMECSGNTKSEWTFNIFARVKDMYSNTSYNVNLLSSDEFVIKNKQPLALPNVEINMISNKYYNNNDPDGNNVIDNNSVSENNNIPNNDSDSLWPTSLIGGRWFDFESLTTLNQDTIKELLTSNDYENKIQLEIRVTPTSSTKKLSLSIKEICFCISTNDNDKKYDWIKIEEGGIERVDPYEDCSMYNDQKREPSGSKQTTFPVTYKIVVPDVLKNATSSHLCMDIDINELPTEWTLECKAYRVKNNGSVKNDESSDNLFVNGFRVPVKLNNTYNFFPANIPTNTESTESVAFSLWPVVSGANDSRFQQEFNIKEMTQIKPAIIEMMQQGLIEKYVEIVVIGECNNVDHGKINIKFNDLGIIGLTKQEFTEDEIYTSCEGETFYGVDSNSVYGALYNILGQYDGLEITDRINAEMGKVYLGNLDTRRNTPDKWCVGRQIWERKNSFDYIKELCRQSFVGAFPSRKGALTFNAWREQSNNHVPYFNEENIIRDSIKNFKRTEPQDLYNDFRIFYDYEPGGDTFSKCIFVTKTNENEFPEKDGEDENGYTWTSYVGGVPFNNDYEFAKKQWEQCHEGYKFTGKIQTAPESLTNLEWCMSMPDYSPDKPDEPKEPSASDEHALKYLVNLIGWTTRPKAQVEFSIPLNGYVQSWRNLTLELLDEIEFSDKIYTQGEIFTGYIIKIEPDLKKNEIKLGVIFEPDDYADIIIERGIPQNDLMPQIEETGEGENSDRVEAEIHERGSAT